MQGIISLLDENADRQIRHIWDLLEERLGCNQARQSLAPHVSWHVAGDYPYDALHDGLTRLVNGHAPLQTLTAGLGIFLQPTPVLFLTVTVTEEILAFHSLIHTFAQPLATDANPCYMPDRWVPHITLAYHDLVPERMGEAIKLLSGYTLEFPVRIDNVGILCPGPDRENEICRIGF